ncbi:hypothetical protein QE152_g37442 [Popillia japonica]|uniref:Uncharacterized protein n=1 Tax=Popillia japonica TaxID=7064 RepID=A0AAW1IAJ7_POPJA
MIGCMKATPLGQLYKASRCQASAIRRLAIEHIRRLGQTFDSYRPLFEVLTRPNEASEITRGIFEPSPNRPTGYLAHKLRTFTRFSVGLQNLEHSQSSQNGGPPDQDKPGEMGDYGYNRHHVRPWRETDHGHLFVRKNCPNSCSLEHLWPTRDNTLKL